MGGHWLGHCCVNAVVYHLPVAVLSKSPPRLFLLGEGVNPLDAGVDKCPLKVLNTNRIDLHAQRHLW